MNRKGFTLIEVGIVIALFMVLAAIGWGSTRGQMPRYRLIRGAKSLKGDLTNLKNLAVNFVDNMTMWLVESKYRDGCRRCVQIMFLKFSHYKHFEHLSIPV